MASYDQIVDHEENKRLKNKKMLKKLKKKQQMSLLENPGCGQQQSLDLAGKSDESSENDSSEFLDEDDSSSNYDTMDLMEDPYQECVDHPL